MSSGMCTAVVDGSGRVRVRRAPREGSNGLAKPRGCVVDEGHVLALDLAAHSGLLAQEDLRDELAQVVRVGHGFAAPLDEVPHAVQLMESDAVDRGGLDEAPAEELGRRVHGAHAQCRVLQVVLGDGLFDGLVIRVLCEVPVVGGEGEVRVMIHGFGRVHEEGKGKARTLPARRATRTHYWTGHVRAIAARPCGR